MLLVAREHYSELNTLVSERNAPHCICPARVSKCTKTLCQYDICSTTDRSRTAAFLELKDVHDSCIHRRDMCAHHALAPFCSITSPTRAFAVIDQRKQRTV
jgi:hypothetical protein